MAPIYKLNPFLYGKPVPMERFVGREQVLRTLFSRIYNGEGTTIVGRPKIGKTSLLYYIADPAVRAQRLAPLANDLAAIYFDCQMLPQSARPADFWQHILDEIVRTFASEKILSYRANAHENHYGAFTLQSFFAALGQSGQRVVLLLDEFDMLLSLANFNTAEFFGGLRSLTSVIGGPTLISASHHSLAEMNRRTPHGTGSPYFNLSTDLPLGPLSADEAGKLIDHALRESKIVFDDNDRGYIQRLTGGYPYLVQAAGAALFEATEQWSGERRMREATAILQTRTSAYFDNLWSQFPIEARGALQAIAAAQLERPAQRTRSSQQTIDQPAYVLDGLVRDGLLQSTADGHGLSWRGETWHISAESFAHWIMEHGRPSVPIARPAPAARSVSIHRMPAEPIEVTLQFTRTRAGARIAWNSHMGQYSSKCALPYKAEDLSLVIKALDEAQYPVDQHNLAKFTPAEQQRLSALGLWSSGHTLAAIHKRVGRQLYSVLTHDLQAKAALATIRSFARSQDRPINYILRFGRDTVEFAALPWEALHDGDRPLLLANGGRQLDSCVRYLDLDEALSPPMPAGSKLHILALAPYAGIPTDIRDQEREARLRSWEALKTRGLADWDELAPVTTRSLDNRMRRGPLPDIIHYYGHGTYRDGQGYLLFDHPEQIGQYELVSVSRLAAVLGRIRLIVIHACQSAKFDPHDRQHGLLTGVAPALAAVSEAVVAMQLTVRIEAATRFAEIFYQELASGRSLQTAVTEGRRSLYVIEPDGASWYVPTLYLRTREHKQIFFLEG